MDQKQFSNSNVSVRSAIITARGLLIGYNIVCSGLCECNEHHPLQTCCNL